MPEELASTSSGEASEYTTIIALLRAELERERASHARTHDIAEVEILTLRAQLARREAELEAAVSVGGHHDIRHIHRESYSKQEVDSIPDSRVVPAQVPRLLGLSAARHKILETEVMQLNARVSIVSHVHQAVPI